MGKEVGVVPVTCGSVPRSSVSTHCRPRTPRDRRRWMRRFGCPPSVVRVDEDEGKRGWGERGGERVGGEDRGREGGRDDLGAHLVVGEGGEGGGEGRGREGVRG